MVSTHQLRKGKIGPPQAFRAFRDRGFRFLWPANFLTYTSRWMQITLLSWMVLELTDSAWLVALVGFFGMAPMLLLGLVGGVLADSVSRQRLVVATQSGSLVAALVMMVLLVAGLEQFWHAYVTIFVIGAAWALDMPSRRAAIHDLVGKSGLANAVALDSVGMSASIMLGPAAAGALISFVGVPGGYVVVTLASFASVALLTKVRLPAARRGDGARPRLAASLLVGLRYVAAHPTLRATVAVTLIMNLLLFPYGSMVPVISRDLLHVGPLLMGLLIASAGLGSLAGAMAIATASSIRYHGRMHAGGSIIALIALWAFSLSKWYFLSVTALLVLGLGTAAFSTMQATIVMLVAREDMRGKALGVLSLAIGAGPLGALLVGALASLSSPSFALWLDALLGLGGVVLVTLFMPSLRQRTLPEGQD